MFVGLRTLLVAVVVSLILSCSPEEAFDPTRTVYEQYVSGEIAQEQMLDAYHSHYPLSTSLTNQGSINLLGALQADAYQYGLSLYQAEDYSPLNEIYGFFLEVENFRIAKNLDWSSEDSIKRYLASLGYFAHLFKKSDSASNYYNSALAAAQTYEGDVAGSVLDELRQSISFLTNGAVEAYLESQGMDVSLQSTPQIMVMSATVFTDDNAVDDCGVTCNFVIMPMSNTNYEYDGCDKCADKCYKYKLVDGERENGTQINNPKKDSSYEDYNGQCVRKCSGNDVRNNSGTCKPKLSCGANTTPSNNSTECTCNSGFSKRTSSTTCDRTEAEAAAAFGPDIDDDGDEGGTDLDDETNLPKPPGNTEPGDDNFDANAGTGASADGQQTSANSTQQSTTQGDPTATGSDDPSGLPGQAGNDNTTGCPVEFTTGCKVWNESDLALTTTQRLDISRGYKRFNQNDFTLGKFWSFSLDSRIILGHDDIQVLVDWRDYFEERITHYQEVIALADEKDNWIDAKWAALIDKYDILQGLVDAEKLEWDTTYRQPAIEKRDAYQALYEDYTAQVQAAQNRFDANEYSALHASDKTASISDDRIKWIAPNGGQFIFTETDDFANPEPVGHGHRLQRTLLGYQVNSTDGKLYSYNNYGLLVEILDTKNNTITIVRSHSDPLIIESVKDNNGRTLTFDYSRDADHHVDAIVDAAGRKLEYLYQTNGNNKFLHQVIGFDGLVTTFEYTDDYGPWLIESRTKGEDSRGLEYGESDFFNYPVVTKQTEAKEGIWTYDYSVENQTTVTDRKGRLQTTYFYNNKRQLLRTEHVDLNGEYELEQTSMGYDPESGLRDTIIDEEGHISNFGYNDQGRRTTNSVGELGEHVSNFVNNRLEDSTNGKGEQVDYEYNGLGLLIGTTFASETDVLGNELSYTYFPNTNLIHTKTQHGDDGDYVETYTYDNYGYVTSVSQTTPYSAEPVITASIINDAIGRKRFVTDAEGRTTNYFYCEDHINGGVALDTGCPQNSRDLDQPVRIEMPPVITVLDNGTEQVDHFAITFEYDEYNRLDTKTDYTGVTTQYTYFANNDVASKTETIPHADGDIVRSWVYTYTPEQKLATVVEKQSAADEGRQTNYEYDFRNRLIKTVVMLAPGSTEESNISEEFDYFANGWLMSKIDAEENQWGYTYYPSGLLETETNPDGGVTSYYYDGAGRLIETEEAVQYQYGASVMATRSFTPTTRGWNASTQDADGAIWDITYSMTGAELSRTVNNAQQSTWTNAEFNHLGQATKSFLPEGEEITRTYSNVGQLLTETNAVDDTTILDYDAMGRIIYRLDANGLKTNWVYEQLATELLVTRTQTDTANLDGKIGRIRIERNAYDLLGRLIRTEQDVSATQMEAAKTLVWDYVYNDQGLLQYIYYPELDAFGLPLVTEYQYDAYGRLEVKIDPGNQTTEYNAINGLGQAESISLPGFGAQTYQYNFRGQPTQVTLPDANNSTVNVTYNSRGEKEYAVDAVGLEEQWRYSAEGRLTSYQNLGNQNITPIVPGLNATSYQYTELGNIESVTNAEFETVTYHYDANGNSEGRTDAANTVFDVESDAIGRVINQWQAEDPINYIKPNTHTQYLGGGRTVIITDDHNAQTTLTYNAFGELEKVADSEGNIVQYAFNERGELILQIDQLNNAQYFAYNTRGQITAQQDAQSRITTMDYNDTGTLGSITQPDVGTTHYGYEDGNRLTTVTSAKGFAQNDPRYTQQYDYDALGNLDFVTNELGLQTQYDIDASGRLNRVTLPNQQFIDYQYNALGQMTQRQSDFDVTTQEEWGYDSVGRLTSISNSNYAESYQYTQTGALDLVTNTTLGMSIDYQNDANNRRIGMAIYNDIPQQNVTYQRDALGRIKTLTEGDDTFTFGYDSLHRLISKTASNGTRDLTLYNERGETIAVVLQRMQTQQEIVDNGRQYGFDAELINGYKRSNNKPHGFDLFAFEDHINAVSYALAEQFTEHGYITEDILIYQYDISGNLIAKAYAEHGCSNVAGTGCTGATNDVLTFFYEYDDADRLITAYEPEGLITQYAWDANGNLDSKQVRDLLYDYVYNDANQLVTSYTWRLEHTGNGNSKGNSNKGEGIHKSNGTQSDWDEHHHDQSHYFEFLWDTKVNLSEAQLVTTHQYDANGNLQTETTQTPSGTEVRSFEHDIYGRMTQIDNQYGATVNFDYDSRDRRIKSAQTGWTDVINEDTQKTSADYSYTSLYDGRQEVEQFTGNAQEGYQAYRNLIYRPNAIAGLYGQLLKQELPQWQNQEFDVTGWGEDLAPQLYFHGDYQNSTIKVTGSKASDSYRYAYTPMGQAYGFKHRNSDEQMTRTFSSHSPNRNMVQNLYTGKYAESLTGLTQMDARWYDAQKGRFIQPDQYNHANLLLPKGAQTGLLRYIGRSQSDLLRDPAQQMRYGYVSGNALSWVDPLGLCEPIDIDLTGTLTQNNSWIDTFDSFVNNAFDVVVDYLTEEVDLSLGISGGLGIGGTLSTSGTFDQIVEDRNVKVTVGGGEVIGVSGGASATLLTIPLGEGLAPGSPIQTSTTIEYGIGFGGSISFVTLADDSIAQIEFSVGLIGGLSISNTITGSGNFDLPN